MHYTHLHIYLIYLLFRNGSRVRLSPWAKPMGRKTMLRLPLSTSTIMKTVLRPPPSTPLRRRSCRDWGGRSCSGRPRPRPGSSRPCTGRPRPRSWGGRSCPGRPRRRPRGGRRGGRPYQRLGRPCPRPRGGGPCSGRPRRLPCCYYGWDRDALNCFDTFKCK